jgi:hypothetical protein
MNPSPMPPALLRLLASKLLSGAIWNDLVDWAVDGLAGDLVSPAQRDFAGLPRAVNPFEAEHYFERLAHPSLWGDLTLGSSTN